LFNELFKRHRFAGLVDLRAGSAREVDGGDGDVLFEHTAAQHLAGDDDRLVFLSVPFDAAQVDLSVRVPWLLQSGGDVLPYVGTGIARETDFRSAMRFCSFGFVLLLIAVPPEVES